ncbi:SRPBCC family protein [uncultured Thiodictyon sp.]|uniref:SRPBCC family protein n=1 Tax=uncultured Thiodictyon sp. TaxID=1846217 RepID=UPI0025DDFA93|nr:SRPBCC family protein [uncultured Thiodictyon sp.]
MLTIWRIEAPLEEVFLAIEDSLRWPDWWPGVQKVEEVAAGDVDGINNVRRYVWKGSLPYRMVFAVRVTRIENLVAIEGAAAGDLEGVGRWQFTRQGTVSIVHYDWQVRSTRWWMKLIAPVARSLFIRNHSRIMAQGGAGLARLLRAPLVSQESIDLLAANNPLLAKR